MRADPKIHLHIPNLGRNFNRPGYHILKLIERKSPGFQALEATAAKIRPLLLREKKMAAAKAERGRLEDKYRIKIVAAPTETENRHGL